MRTLHTLPRISFRFDDHSRSRILLLRFRILLLRYRILVLRAVKKTARAIWSALALGPIVTFVTGVLVGLLIPSRHWVAIVAVIVIGAVLGRIVSSVDDAPSS